LASLGHLANFNGFHVLAALLHSQTAALQGGHHGGHWPTFLVFSVSIFGSMQNIKPAYISFEAHVNISYHIVIQELVFLYNGNGPTNY